MKNAFLKWIGLGAAGVGVTLAAFEAGSTPAAKPKVNSDGAGALPLWSDADFLDLQALCLRLKMNPADLLLVMASESGLQPSAVNPRGGAAGLIQWTSATNDCMKLTEVQRQQIPSKSVAEQLPLVERYFRCIAWTRDGKTYPHAGSVYQAIFAPGLMSRGSGLDVVLYRKGVDGRAYLDNEGLDVARKGTITVGDLVSRMRSVSTREVYASGLCRLRQVTGVPYEPGLPS